MLVVDSQVHIWDGGIPTTFPWQRQVEAFSKDELLQEMSTAGVDRAVIVPPIFTGERNELALAAAGAHPDKFCVMGRISLDRSRSEDVISTWCDQPGMKGVRITFSRPEEREAFANGELEWLWHAAQEADMPVMMLPARMLDALEGVVTRFPALRVALDHLGASGGTDADAFAELDAVVGLTRFPNVCVKLSSAPSYSSEPYPFHNIQPFIRRLFDSFGPERLFWGSDMTRLPEGVTYRQCVSLFTDELPWLSADDKELIMGTALSRWLRWSP